jgi:hypothetical protein
MGGVAGCGGGGVSAGCLGGTQEFRLFHRGGEVERRLPGRSGTHVAGVRRSLAKSPWIGVLRSVAPLGLDGVAGGARADARAYHLSRLRRWSRTLAGGRPQPRCGWDRMGTVIQGSLASSAPLLRLSRARQTLGYSPVCLDPRASVGRRRNDQWPLCCRKVERRHRSRSVLDIIQQHVQQY